MPEALRHARWVLPAGRWPADHEVGTVTLGWDDRHRRRIRLSLDPVSGDCGSDGVLLDLHRAARLGADDGLLLDDGGIVRVVAAPEPVLEIRAGTTSLARLAYHLGNRHLPIEIGPNLLVVRRDHVIEAMVAGLGGDVTSTERPFSPEAGAYGEHRHDGHDHSHAAG